MELFFEVNHCVVLFMTDVRLSESTCPLFSLQYKLSLTATIAGANWSQLVDMVNNYYARIAREGTTAVILARV